VVLPNSYDVGPCLEALGTYDPRANLGIADEMVMTIQVADFARSFATELVEPRLLAMAHPGPVVAQTPVVHVNPRGNPLVLEQLDCESDQPLLTFIRTTDASIVSVRADMEIGGRDFEGRVRSGTTGSPHTASAAGFKTEINNATFSLAADQRLFIRPDENFVIQSGVGAELQVALIVRQLPGLPYLRG